MKTITFYSYKGGVGRSLALANIATRLAELGKKVCLLDFDLEAPGLHYKFSSILNDQQIVIKEGIVDYIHQFATEGKLSSRVSNYSYRFLNFSISATTAAETILIPAGNTDSPDYWKKLSAINWSDLLFENNSGLAFLLNLKEKIRNEIAPEFLLIDSRTGISEMSGITLSLLADEVVVLAANNRENLEGAKKIIKSISDPNNNIFGKTPEITFVLSRIPFTDKPEDRAKEQSLIAKVSKELEPWIKEINVIHSDRELEEEEQIKIGYEKDGVHPQVSRDYLKLFEKLTPNAFTEDQKKAFENIKEAERLYQKAISEDIVLKKLELINKAIELNNRNKEFFLYKASIHKQLGDTNVVVEQCEKAISLDTRNLRAYELLGKTHIKRKEYDKARRAFETILGFDKNHIGAKLGLAKMFVCEKNYDKALVVYNEVIEMDGENANAYNGRANVKVLTNNYIAALEDVYKALSYNPEYVKGFASLAEINARLNNINEFYLNIERALKLDLKWTEGFIKDRRIQEVFVNDKRFEKLVEKYNLDLKGN